MGKPGRPKKDIPLPEWFDLGKYARAGELTLAEWSDQLYIRFMLYHRYTGAVRDSGVAVVRRDGLVDSANIPFMVQLATLKEWHKGNPGDSLGVCRMTGDILYEIYECLNKPETGDEWRGEPIERHSGGLVNEAALIVDLSLPDTVLVEQFKEMIQAIRQEKAGPAQTNIVPSHWAKYGVLPYLDLNFWARMAKVDLKKTQLARTLFPEDREGARWKDIKKYTVPAAARLMNPAFLRRLAHCVEKGNN